MSPLPTALPTTWLVSGLLACILDADAAFQRWVLLFDICLGPFALLIALATPGKKGTAIRSERLVMGLIILFSLVVFALCLGVK